MASQHDQNGMRSNHQSDPRDNELRGRSPSSSGSHYQQGQGAEFGDDNHSGGRSDYPRGGDHGRQEGRDEGRWGRSHQEDERQVHRDSPYPPPIYGGERGRDEHSGRGHDQGVFAHQRHGASGQSYGRSQQDSGFGQGGGYAQSSYGQRGSYNQRGFENRDFGQGGFGQGGSGPGSAQERAMQGLSHYDQDYDSPYRGSYGGGGYGEDHRPSPSRGNFGQQQFGHGGQGMQDSGQGGNRRGGYERGEDGPSEASYLGDSDRGNWARSYGGEGRGGSSAMGYTARGQGGSGYAEQSGSAGNRSGGSFRGMGPRGYRRSDERLCEDINERLTDDDHIDASDISVDVKEGVVTLSGEVDERRLKHRIEDMIEGCHGVQDIRNEIRVKRSGNDRSGGRSGSGEGLSASGGTPAASGFSGGGSSSSSGSGLGSDSADSKGSSASGGATGQGGLSSGQRNGNEESSSTDQSGTSAASRKK